LVGDAQSPSTAQLVSHVIPLVTHTSPPAHACGVPPVQVPVPLHTPFGVRVLPEHITVPHTMPLAACSHAPAAPHLPSLPQGGDAVHWPLGAGLPVR